MFDFLALPTEIRYEIYRHLRRYVSLSLSVPVSSFGYASYGFYPAILITNHQVSYEAKQVFYGENDCTYPYDHVPLSACCPTYGYIHPNRIAYCANVYYFWFPFTQNIADLGIIQGHSMLVGTFGSTQIGPSLRLYVLRFHSYAELTSASDCITGCTHNSCLFRNQRPRLPSEQTSIKSANCSLKHAVYKVLNSFGQRLQIIRY